MTSYMEGEDAQKQGTGLIDVFKILEEAPRERLLSLTFQLGACPEEDIVLALTLIILRRVVPAVNKLHALRDKNNNLANRLAEKWHMSGGQLEDFRVKCGDFQDIQGETLADLARIFRVLSEQRLCDTLLRDLAYQRALCAKSHRATDEQPLVYTPIDQLREEAKHVCGPKFAEWMCSFRGLQPVSHRDPEARLDNSSSAALKHSLSQDQSKSNLPSSLQVSSSVVSFPSRLEISLASTVPCEGSMVTPASPDHSCDTLQHVSEGEVKNSAIRPPGSSEEPKSKRSSSVKGERDLKMDTPGFATLPTKCSKLAGHTTQTQHLNQKTTAVPITVATPEPNSLPAPTKKVPESKVPKQTREEDKSGVEEEEEEEAVFYSFVILHAPEDTAMADSMREKIESCGVSMGATFTEDFAVPGRSTLKCVEDAINNSAFTILLLTKNFNTRLLEVETDSALINSINKKPKYNTVIPLLPLENALPREGMPMVLQTLIPLEENKNFEKKIKKALTSAKIEPQRRVWLEEQRVKKQVRRQEKLRVDNKLQRQFIREYTEAEQLELERLRLSMHRSPLGHPGMPYNSPYWGPQFSSYSNFPVPPPQQLQQQLGDGDGRLWWPPQGSIHIENAKYIMIGNDSQMSVELGGAANGDDLSDNED